ncbi:hypothetical protein ACIBAC_00275 [Streptomyces sp. NPDC051362]|uniref:hypothetical protein n=1 Tax=Streptomyces sp. NPDC051362 TaxID=3365651 RepID=UPI003788A404
MTRYGFAIKALPKGAKPFGQEDDDENDETPGLETASPGASDSSQEPADELPDDPSVPPFAPVDDAAAPAEDPAAVPAEGATPEGDDAGGEPADGAPPQPEDDSRPWAGDEYNEGDETDPNGPQSWSAFTGSNGEQAWLDKGTDGTLTGWVRDATGQVWRYTDPDAWALDVDGAQMTQTHHNGEDSAQPAVDGASGGQPPGDRGKQDLMFAGQ